MGAYIDTDLTSNQKGFSLIEMLIAMAILALAMLAAASMQFGAIRNNASGNMVTQAILVVAENRVMIVDGVIGGEQLTTQVIDADGEPISLEELNSGQRVLVQGLKLVDGRVVGVKVQQR